MAAPSIVRTPTCLNCLRQLARPSPVTISLTQTRGARATKAELEDLQGIPVRLLRDIPAFGRKDAIIRVKPGRMRNIWFPKAFAEYMTKQRFLELGLTEAAIGVRDRTFGSKLLLDESNAAAREPLAEDKQDDHKSKRKEVLTLPPEETKALLDTFLPATLIFKRKPIAAPIPEPAPAPVPVPEPEPVAPRSPSLATHAATSIPVSPPPPSPFAVPTPVNASPSLSSQQQQQQQAIFGSVSTSDILAQIKEMLLEGDPQQGSRVALESEGVAIEGLEKDEDRIKRLGTFVVRISPGKGLEPVRRVVSVIPDE
ncbi:hypothetical protein F5X99DRAFT_406753 [Biscogniauxia marginata]|nr:hypothetical protein F5X99DRAFT_406753 [Biscogniauxia marginata]